MVERQIEPEFIGLTVNDDGQLFMMMREAAKTGAY